MRPSALQLERGDAIEQVAVCWQKEKINWREPHHARNKFFTRATDDAGSCRKCSLMP
jgi:hypothetical protein